jgi:protein-S-isoprenylcysteine O-methyltransferase Ste14
MLSGGVVLGITLDTIWFRELLLNPWWHLATMVLGLLLLKLVFLVSRNTGRKLSKYGRKGKLPRFETNRLVTTGFYDCMRHPMHFGLLFLLLAVALIVGSPSSIFLIVPCEAVFMLLIIRFLEEAEATKIIGVGYTTYKKGVPAFNLRWHCLKRLFSVVE